MFIRFNFKKFIFGINQSYRCYHIIIKVPGKEEEKEEKEERARQREIDEGEEVRRE